MTDTKTSSAPKAATKGGARGAANQARRPGAARTAKPQPGAAHKGNVDDAISKALQGRVNVSPNKAVEMAGQLYRSGIVPTAVLTMLPGFERVGEVVVAADGSFTATVEITEAITGPDPHYLVVTGQGADGLFAYLATEVNLVDVLSVGGLVRPPGVRPPPERPERPQVRSPIDALRRDLRQRPLDNESEGADELWLALILLLFFAATAWFLHYSLHNDVRAGLARQRVRIQRRLGLDRRA